MKKFVSIQINPSVYYNSTGRRGAGDYFLNLDLESARHALNSLDEVIQELEKEEDHPSE